MTWFELALQINSIVDADTEDEWVIYVEVPAGGSIAEGGWAE